MNGIKALLLASMLMSCVTCTLAQPAPTAGQPAPGETPAPNVRIRGTATEFDGHALHVTGRDGKSLTVNVSDATKISVLSPLKMQDIKQGSFVGVTAVLRGPGSTLEALEVHVFPESMRGTGEGHYDWDLQPGSTMTNANVEAVVTTRKGKVLTLGYKGGSQKIIVPKGVPIITFAPADRSLLKPDAQVFIIARPRTDGNLAALRILVGKDGIKPPM